MCPCVLSVLSVVCCPRSVLDTILNVSELVNAVSGVKKQSKSGYFWDSDRFWIQILNVSELENAVSGVQNESKSGNRVPFGPPLPCGCNLVLFERVMISYLERFLIGSETLDSERFREHSLKKSHIVHWQLISS